MPTDRHVFDPSLQDLHVPQSPRVQPDLSDWNTKPYIPDPYVPHNSMNYPDQVDYLDDHSSVDMQSDLDLETELPHPLQWLTYWQVWGAAAVLVFSGTGFFAAANLLHLPAVTNCPAIFLPTASASMRMSCAQAAANKGTPNGYLEAIALVNGLPANHALRPHINDMVQQWAESYLDLAEKAFQEGRLKDAIEAARRLPKNVPMHRQIEGRIQKWQTIWQKGELIFQATESAMRKRDWGKAYSLAARLLTVENEYWSTAKYRELASKILSARQTNTKINRALALAKAGDLYSLLDAIDLLVAVEKTDYLYGEAQKELKKITLQLLAIAQDSLDEKNYKDAMSILQRLPNNLGLEQEIQDFTTLAKAQAKSWSGTITDLQDAILQAEQITVNSALYGNAQRFVKRWRSDIDAVNRLALAEQLAMSGDRTGLASAIAEANRVSDDSNRWRDAQQKIDLWRTQLETLEDRPLLNQARTLALPGDIPSLRTAVAQANRIQPGRALYEEAQKDVAIWTGRIQEFEDRPILQQARDLANSGRLEEAIITAEQIGRGRALSGEAQQDIKTWRDQTLGRQRLEQARQLATTGSLADLRQAIQTAEQVPQSSTYRSNAQVSIDQWSRQLLFLATERAQQLDIAGAIDLANDIPPSASSYSDAQQRITMWRSQLNPR